uniref:Uncharacterized protein n=1 Tax=Aegilops tauschii subsp. strangulata TaxID=200361 RepID=A0A453EFK1_AEGTS
PSAAPSMHQNHLDTDTQSLLAVVDPVLADTESADVRPALVVPPQAAAASPPPTLVAAPDLAQATPQPQEEGSASTSTTLLPLPAMVAAASPPPPLAGSDAEQGLQQLSRVLASLGYNELASEAPLLALAPPLARWPGAITVFAAPDVFVQALVPHVLAPRPPRAAHRHGLLPLLRARRRGHHEDPLRLRRLLHPGPHRAGPLRHPLRQDLRRWRRGVPPRALQRRPLRRPRHPRLPAPAHALLLRRPAPPPPHRHRPLRRRLRGDRCLRGAHHDPRRHRAPPRPGLRLHGAGHARPARRAREVRQPDALRARRPGHLRRRRPPLRLSVALPHRPRPPPHPRRPPSPPPWHDTPHAGRRGPEPRRHQRRRLRLGLQLRRQHQLHADQGARRGGQLPHRRPRRLHAVPPPPPRQPRRLRRPDEQHLRRRGTLRRPPLLSDDLSQGP